jgi:cytochrome c
MNSFELNKIMGAILGTCLMLVALNITAGAVFTPAKPAKPGYAIAVPEKPKGDQKGAPAQQDPPVEQVLAKADVARGQQAAQKCLTCHTFDKGGRPLVGPNLWGVIGRPKASVTGFNYTPGMKKMSGNWTVQDLYEFLANPRAMAQGTAMTLNVSRATERADIIAYLNSQSDNPQPLPKAAEAPGAPKAQ